MTGNRKVREGIVLSRKMDKTAIVSVERLALDKTFKKYMKRSKKFKVHDEKNETNAGDRVQIVETSPISKEKHWKLQKIVKKAEAAI